MDVINIFQSVVSIPFSAQGNGVLWFMYTLTGLYLLAPILSAWLDKASDKELKFILLLWVVSLCFPILKFYFLIDTSTSGILYYFTGYAGYFVLGYALRHRRLKLSLPINATISLIGVILLFFLKFYKITFDFYSLFWYESIFIVALCSVIWILLCKTSRKYLDNSKSKMDKIKVSISHLIVTLSNLSFGIYLTHILIMREWLWKIEWVKSIGSYEIQSITIALLSFLLSSLMCMLISRTSLGDVLIGYRYKNHCKRSTRDDNLL